MKMKMFLATLTLGFLSTGVSVDRGGWDHNGTALNDVERKGGGWDLNGVRLNGVRLNGVRLNGVRLNGGDLNRGGWDRNGVRLNGVRLNGVRLNGTDLQSDAAPGSVKLDDAQVVGGRFTR